MDSMTRYRFQFGSGGLLSTSNRTASSSSTFRFSKVIKQPRGFPVGVFLSLSARIFFPSREIRESAAFGYIVASFRVGKPGSFITASVAVETTSQLRRNSHGPGSPSRSNMFKTIEAKYLLGIV